MTNPKSTLKLAIFVEGLTEQVFVEKLVYAIAGHKNISIVKHRAYGGNRAIRDISTLEASGTSASSNFLVLIVNCGADNTVASDIRESYEGLALNGYATIIGIRDVYPISLAEIGKLRVGLNYRVKTNPIQVHFVLGVMEVEAWFIAEHTHFQKINSKLTNTHISLTVGFDPTSFDATSLPKPADTLNKIYKSVGLAYRKKTHQIERTVEALDYARIYVDLRTITDLSNLVDKIDGFLQTTPAQP